jgi:hypothetical protein
MHTGNLNPVEYPSRREQHPTNPLPLPTRLLAGASATQPTRKPKHWGKTDGGYLQTDLLLVRDDSRLQGLERAFDDWSPDSLVCDLLHLKGLYEF